MEYFKDCMTKEQLEQEHRRLVIKMHPDRNPDNPNATAEFQEMQAQYEERKAELEGDYTKARKGRERREREERERQERERKEREQRKVEQVIAQARANKQKSHRELKAGDYVYAWKVKGDASVTLFARSEYILRAVLTDGVNDEAVIKIETVMELTDDAILCDDLHHKQPGGGPWGGWEVLQSADLSSGVKKSKRVAKVIMFRSEHYCFFGNPMGDQIISTFYMPSMYSTMFHTQLDTLIAKIAWERKEKERIDAERKEKLLAEQAPLIEEWKDKLIGISMGLTQREQQTVALDNLKTMLKQKFPGVTFKVKADKYALGNVHLEWEDGPVTKDVDKVIGLFEPWLKFGNELTPWQERFGRAVVSDTNRKMSVLTKAKILQQLGQVTEAFRNGAMEDDVTVNDFDWMMLHMLVGIKVDDPDAKLCISTLHADGTRTVRILSAVSFVFNHTSYAKQPKARKKAA